jgi:hypothetical protein
MSESSPPRKRFLPQPVETTTKSVRRFPVEPVETTTSNNKGGGDGPQRDQMAQSKPSTKRRFLPQPVETTVKSNRSSAVKPTIEPTPDPTPESSPRSPQSLSQSSSEQSTPRPRARFAPQLIETTKRSKKAGDPKPATLPTDKTDITPGTKHIYLPRPKTKLSPGPPRPPLVPVNTAADGVVPTHLPPLPPRRQGSMRPHLNTRRSTRQDSFQPELDDIMSSEEEADEEEGEEEEQGGAEAEGTPSLSRSLNSSEDSLMRLQMARTRESCDDRFSGYLLELAAKAAEKQLREQALAAFPNSDFHDPVEHFYDREVEAESDDEDAIGVGLLPHEVLGDVVRRKSTEVGWAAREMQQHQEHLARLREEETHRLLAAEASKPTFKDPFWTNGMTQKMAGIAVHDRQKEAELASMRSAASPPMLGSEILFRMCPSPKATKFESDQKPDIMPSRSTAGGGLWGGYCFADEEEQFLTPAIRGAPMIQTPANERDDPFASAFSIEVPGNQSSKRKSRPTSPDGSKGGGFHMLSGINERLQAELAKSKAEEALVAEFDDKFVTQVYNYLSLGYPSLARQYDEELSKITKVEKEELCKDDSKADVKGHIGVVEKEKAAGAVHCARWSALRLYILEWARQNPGMDGETTSPSAWGVRARRGSWAI